MAPVATVRAAHRLDLTWIIALWKAIHGGDPALAADVEVNATTVLLGTLFLASLEETTKTPRLSETELRKVLERAGIGTPPQGASCPGGTISARVDMAEFVNGLLEIEAAGPTICLPSWLFPRSG